MSEKDVKPKKRQDESAVEKQPAELVPLAAWISQKLAQDKNLRPIQRRELEVFMRKQGLMDVEIAEQYEEAYKKF